MSRIAVIGMGYVGLTTASCLADLGNEVVGIEISPARLRTLRRHQLGFYEPGLQEVMARNVKAGRLVFTQSYAEGMAGAEYAFICVATPEGAAGEADLGAVESAAASIAGAMTGPLVVINKSTVPIGTGDLVSDAIRRVRPDAEVEVVSNPEFLREGSALHDFMQPDRVVIGAHRREAGERVAELYAPLNTTVMITDIYSAEMIKYASNAFLATRISFINEVARIAERVGADIKVVAAGMGIDHRIGPHFLEAGLGYGGSCFPKDVKALAAIGERFRYHPELLHAVMDINRDQRLVAVTKLTECLETLAGRVVAIWGLAFKPDTDDMREAPSLAIAAALLEAGARVRAYDPAANSKAKALLPGIEYKANAYAAARGADAVVLVTEWNEFSNLDLARVKRSMRGSVLVDGRNLYDPVKMRELGFEYRGIGRN